MSARASASMTVAVSAGIGVEVDVGVIVDVSVGISASMSGSSSDSKCFSVSEGLNTFVSAGMCLMVGTAVDMDSHQPCHFILCDCNFQLVFLL